MTPELKQFLVDRATGKSSVALDSISEELFQMYMRDVNSSTLRELITIFVAGYSHVPGKHGRDGIDPVTGKGKEIKPKLYTGKPTNGGGCFNDYTRARFDKDLLENLDIVHSFFIGDKLAYVLEFSIMAVQTKLDKQIRINCEEKGYQYVRSAYWSYSDWINHESMKIHYIDWNLINLYPKCINETMYKSLRDLPRTPALILND